MAETPESLLYTLKVTMHVIETIGCNLDKQELDQISVSDMIDDTKPHNGPFAKKALGVHARTASILIRAYSLKPAEMPKVHNIEDYLQDIHVDLTPTWNTKKEKRNLIITILKFLLDAKRQLSVTTEPGQPAQVSDDYTVSMYLEKHANRKLISYGRLSKDSIGIESADKDQADELLYPEHSIFNPKNSH